MGKEGIQLLSQTQEVKITRTCDVCNTSSAYSQIQGEPIDETCLQVLGGWILLSEDHVIGGALAPIAKLVCSKACALTVLNNDALELPTTPKNVLEFKKVN